MKKHAYPVKFRVKAQFGKGDTSVDPDDDLAIGSDLDRAMRRQPAHYAYYAGLAEEEYHRLKRVKSKIHCLEEDLDAKFRRQREKLAKRMTEREITQAIKRDPRMRALYDKQISTARRAGHLRVMKEAFAQRKDMLQSVGANQRKEMETELRTLKRKLEQRKNNGS